jgi:hypothetical protein
MYYIGQIIMSLQLLHVSGIMLGALILGMGIVLLCWERLYLVWALS